MCWYRVRCNGLIVGCARALAWYTEDVVWDVLALTHTQRESTNGAPPGVAETGRLHVQTLSRSLMRHQERF
jgi:hypothetical protein